MATRTSRPGQRGKSIEEVVSFAVSHRTRVHVLVVLVQGGAYTASQIAEIIGEPLNNVSNHIRELLDAGSIEIAKTEQKGNVVQHYYRAIEFPYYSEEDLAAMPPMQRHVLAGLAVQSMMAELMAALWAGKMTDPRINLSWNWFNVDEEGRRAIAEEQERSWDRIQEIEIESMNRRAVTGDDAQSILVGEMGFERARKAPKFPESSPNGERGASSD
jgi:DNA-binding transcriptional ArsR family regulator